MMMIMMKLVIQCVTALLKYDDVIIIHLDKY